MEEEGRDGSGLRLNGRRIEGGYLVHQENGWKRIRICKFRRRRRESSTHTLPMSPEGGKGR